MPGNKPLSFSWRIPVSAHTILISLLQEEANIFQTNRKLEASCHHILVGSFDFQCQTGSLQGLGFRISYCNLWTCGHVYFMRWIYKRLNSLKHMFIFPDSSTELTESLTWCNRAETFVDLLSQSTNTAYTLLLFYDLNLNMYFQT